MKSIIVFVPIQLDIDENTENRVDEVVKKLETIQDIVADSKLDSNPNFLLSGIGNSEIIDSPEEE